MQPDPVEGKLTPSVFLVVNDVLARGDFGKKKYGVEHTADNGRDHLIDAYEEALDLAIYLRAEILKRSLLAPPNSK